MQGISSKEWLLSQLNSYLGLQQRLFSELEEFDPQAETARLEEIKTFVQQMPEPFHRSTLSGHITGSAQVVNADLSKMVLLHHGKLNIWIQPGGHSDGEGRTDRVAIREVEEETGLLQLEGARLSQSGVGVDVVDVDIHSIPARKNEPEHKHLDIRFFIRSLEEDLTLSDESHDLRWFDFDEAARISGDPSVIRLIAKGRHLRDKYAEQVSWVNTRDVLSSIEKESVR